MEENKVRSCTAIQRRNGVQGTVGSVKHRVSTDSATVSSHGTCTILHDAFIHKEGVIRGISAKANVVGRSSVGLAYLYGCSLRRGTLIRYGSIVRNAIVSKLQVEDISTKNQ